MTMISKVKAWLQLFRAHSGMLEGMTTAFAAAMSIGSVFSPTVVVWGIWGLLAHYAGYGMNSYVDWVKGFDKEDSDKQHHPLNKGTLSKDEAKYGVIVMMLLSLFSGLALGGFSHRTIIAISAAVLSGTAYNFLGKYTTLKFIPVSLSYMFIFVVPYVGTGGDITPVFMLLSAYIFLQYAFAIAYSGEIKDIVKDEANLMKTLGARVRDIAENAVIVEMPASLLYTAYISTSAQIGIVTIALVYQNSQAIAYPLLWMLGVYMAFQVDHIVRPGRFDRESRVESMAKKELSGLYMVYLVVIPIAGLQGYFAMVAVKQAYLLLVSKFIWGTWVTPQV